MQNIVFLGFVLNSVEMTVRLTFDRANSLKELCQEVLMKTKMSVRDFAVLIGKMVASEPGYQFAPLYYKDLEHIRDMQLKLSHGNYDAHMTVTDDIKYNLKWWIEQPS